jgi:hypothetical protein
MAAEFGDGADILHGSAGDDTIAGGGGTDERPGVMAAQNAGAGRRDESWPFAPGTGRTLAIHRGGTRGTTYINAEQTRQEQALKTALRQRAIYEANQRDKPIDPKLLAEIRELSTVTNAAGETKIDRELYAELMQTHVPEIAARFRPNGLLGGAATGDERAALKEDRTIGEERARGKMGWQDWVPFVEPTEGAILESARKVTAERKGRGNGMLASRRGATTGDGASMAKPANPVVGQDYKSPRGWVRYMGLDPEGRRQWKRSGSVQATSAAQKRPSPDLMPGEEVPSAAGNPSYVRAKPGTEKYWAERARHPGNRPKRPMHGGTMPGKAPPMNGLLARGRSRAGGQGPVSDFQISMFRQRAAQGDTSAWDQLRSWFELGLIPQSAADLSSDWAPAQ